MFACELATRVEVGTMFSDGRNEYTMSASPFLNVARMEGQWVEKKTIPAL
jgi:hypothetical protein